MTEQQIDLTQLSLDELLLLSSRVELRIKDVQSAPSAGSQVHEDGPASGGRADHSTPASSCPATASQEIETLSERVRGLIHVNDPWEGSGLGPLRWTHPFFGGSIIRGLPQYMPKSAATVLPTWWPLQRSLQC